VSLHFAAKVLPLEAEEFAMLCRHHVLTAVALSFMSPAAAAEPADPPVDCASASSTYEINYCSEQDFEKADEELNAIYKKALASIPKQASDESRFDAKHWEDALRASQRAWLAYRDAECSTHVPMFWTGGTGTTAAVIGCQTQKTKARVEELRNDYEAN
jgi:uncharacterized protein YecT (DUF1311 family)